MAKTTKYYLDEIDFDYKVQTKFPFFFLRFSTYKIQIGIETREPIDANFCIFKIRTSLNMQ